MWMRHWLGRIGESVSEGRSVSLGGLDGMVIVYWAPWVGRIGEDIVAIVRV